MGDNASQLGSLDKKDIPVLVKNTSRFHGELYHRVQWKQRKDGSKPLDSYVALEVLRRQAPDPLLNYLISKIKIGKEIAADELDMTPVLNTNSANQVPSLKQNPQKHPKKQLQSKQSSEADWTHKLIKDSIDQAKTKSYQASQSEYNFMRQPSILPHPKTDAHLDLSSWDDPDFKKTIICLSSELNGNWMSMALEVNINSLFI